MWKGWGTKVRELLRCGLALLHTKKTSKTFSHACYVVPLKLKIAQQNQPFLPSNDQRCSWPRETARHYLLSLGFAVVRKNLRRGSILKMMNHIRCHRFPFQHFMSQFRQTLKLHTAHRADEITIHNKMKTLLHKAERTVNSKNIAVLIQ